MNAVLIILAFFCFSSFSWAAVFFFKVEDSGSKLGKYKYTVLGICSIIFSMVAVTNSHQNNIVLYASFLLFISSITLFWWTILAVKTVSFSFAGSTSTPQSIISTGPFYFIRHPFYVSYLLGWFAAAVAGGQIYYYIIPCVMWCFYFIDAKAEELLIASGPHKQEYEKYQSSTGMFLPFRFFLRIPCNLNKHGAGKK